MDKASHRNQALTHPQLARPKGSPKVPSMLAREPRAPRRCARRTPAAAAIPQAAKAAPGTARVGTNRVQPVTYWTVESHLVTWDWDHLGSGVS